MAVVASQGAVGAQIADAHSASRSVRTRSVATARAAVLALRRVKHGQILQRILMTMHPTRQTYRPLLCDCP